MPHVPGHPRAWRFAFRPTKIPGAERVEIYVSPSGKVLATEPADLESRLQAFHHTGY
jgi:hypothetical protein